MRRSFRYKGVLSVAGKTQKFVFQGVGMLFSGGFVRAEWGADETRENRFVFIGRDLDKQRLLDGFAACKCSEELRFKVGDRVRARCKHPAADADGFVAGIVLSTSGGRGATHAGGAGCPHPSALRAGALRADELRCSVWCACELQVGGRQLLPHRAAGR